MDLDTGADHDATLVRDIPVGEFDELSMNAESIGESEILHQSVEIATEDRRWTHYYHRSRARLRGMRRMPALGSGEGWKGFDISSSEAEGPPSNRDTQRQRIVYRNVCTEADPPYSVTISPIRRCVAFGCRGGVELYWIDPTTGQDLNRWFPLTKPSDHLYFLPPRRHMDSPSRLRLISSAAYRTGPDTASYDDYPLPEATGSSPSRLISWFTLSASWNFHPSTPQRGCAGARQQSHALDHSQAIPLGDGHHILFTDNATGLLCLGSDNPLGNLHRLSRKFVFLPPKEIVDHGDVVVPKTYAASHPNTLGTGACLRLVAAYGNAIVLYSLPPDALKFSTAEQEHAIQEPSSQLPFSDLATLQLLKHPLSNAPAVREWYPNSARFDEVNVKWMHYLPVSARTEQRRVGGLEEVWPLRVEGCGVGSMEEGVASVAVRETEEEGLVVWAFGGAEGVARAWRLN